jgi:uncharacterized protein (UPF0332 family)
MEREPWSGSRYAWSEEHRVSTDLDLAWTLAARCLARRLTGDLGSALVSVQVVGRRASAQAAAHHDLDVLVVLAQWTRSLARRVQRIGAEVERQYDAGLALKVTSPAQIEVMGAKGTPVWELLETGLPLLTDGGSGAPRLALPASPSKPAKAPVHRLSREQAGSRTRARLRSARTLLEAGELADAVSLAHASLPSLAKAVLPRSSLQGRRESELFGLLIRAVPGGPRGPWAVRLRDLRSLRNDLDLGCRTLEDPEEANRAIRTAEDLAERLLAAVPPEDGAEEVTAEEPEAQPGTE